MESDMHHVDNIDCNGNIMGHHGIHGSWFGHVAPGAVFMVWGTWQMLNILIQYVSLQRANQTNVFRSQAAYRFFGLPIELLLKFIIPMVGVTIELRLYSRDKYRALLCPPGSLHGRTWFNAENVNNWQHTTIYPAFVFSGIVDLVATRIPLPPGLDFVALSLGFVIEAIVMGTHTKHIPLDQRLHQIFFGTSAVTSLLCLVESACHTSFLLASAKTVFMILQGTWLCAIAHIMFESHPMWDWQYMASYELTPVLYCYHLLCVVMFYFLCYVTIQVLFNSRAKQQYEHIKREDSGSIEIVNVMHRSEP